MVVIRVRQGDGGRMVMVVRDQKESRDRGGRGRVMDGS